MLAEYIKALLLGVVEGITEWLPISSTGHLILLGPILALDQSESYLAVFDVVIQLGAVLAVAVIYRKELLPNTRQKRLLWLKLMIASIPAAALGLALDKICENTLGTDLDTLLFRPQVVAAALIFYGLLFIGVEFFSKRKKGTGTGTKEITFKKAFAIGCFQALALVPGTSRSGATILGARLLGVSKDEAARFSFFAALPVISAASALKICELGSDLSGGSFTATQDSVLLLITASTVAFCVSLVSIRFLTELIKRRSFAPFGVYRILLGVSVLLFSR